MHKYKKFFMKNASPLLKPNCLKKVRKSQLLSQENTRMKKVKDLFHLKIEMLGNVEMHELAGTFY